MTFEVKSGAPVPPMRRGRPESYPFRDMEIGDCFDVPLSGETRKNSGGYARPIEETKIGNAKYCHETKHGKKFISRLLRDEGVVRCWRVK